MRPSQSMRTETHTFSAADFPFTDVDGDLLQSVTIVSLPTNGTLEFGGAPVSEGQVLTPAKHRAADLHAGRETTTATTTPPSPLPSSDGADDSEVHTLTIDVTPVNDAPEGVPVITGDAAEGSELGVDLSGVADVDGALTPTAYQWFCRWPSDRWRKRTPRSRRAAMNSKKLSPSRSQSKIPKAIRPM